MHTEYNLWRGKKRRGPSKFPALTAGTAAKF
jgi:hypothetical protein